MTVAERITADLRAGLDAEHIVVDDESALHRGHAGAAEGGHYAVTIVAARFAGVDALARHRMVYAALGDLGGRGIHALALETFSPDEWAARDNAGG